VAHADDLLLHHRHLRGQILELIFQTPLFLLKLLHQRALLSPLFRELLNEHPLLILECAHQLLLLV